jgi:transposase
VSRPGQDGKIEKIAEGFELSHTLSASIGGAELTWAERRLVVRSLAQARAAERALARRLDKAQAAIAALNVHKRGKPRLTECADLQQTAEALLEKHRVLGLLVLQYHEHVQERQVRKYGARPAETRVERHVSVSVQRDESAIQEHVRRLGWRVYGTNCPTDMLSLEQAVLAYRAEYLVEHNFGRLKGKPLSLTPMYLQDDQRASALIRLLSVGLRVLTLMEHTVRSQLAETGQALGGLYAGNPTRTTERPTAEAMLRAFKGLFLSLVVLGEHTYYHLTPLSALQQQILGLLDFTVNVYTRLAEVSVNPP